MFSITRLAVAVAFMSYAAVLDWRSRRVSNNVWIVMGAVSLVLLVADMLLAERTTSQGMEKVYGPAAFLVLIPIIILYLDPYREWGLEAGGIDMVSVIISLIGILGALALVYLEGFTVEILHLLAVPAVMFVMVLFYYLGVIKGGADAKALIVLAMLFPSYPIIDGVLPLISTGGIDIELYSIGFPFILLVLMNAALLNVLLVPGFMYMKNLRNGDRGFPEMFLGYRMDLEKVPENFVWPMEVVRDGETVLILFPKKHGRGNVDDIEGEVTALREMGVDRIWVQPKYPFIVFILFGIIFSFVVGNLMFLLF